MEFEIRIQYSLLGCNLQYPQLDIDTLNWILEVTLKGQRRRFRSSRRSQLAANVSAFTHSVVSVITVIDVSSRESGTSAAWGIDVCEK